MALTKREVAILEFERSCWQLEGAKGGHIRHQFELSTGRYYELLGQLLDSTEALAHDPLVVRRLRRQRDQRRRIKYEGQPASQPRAR